MNYTHMQQPEEPEQQPEPPELPELRSPAGPAAALNKWIRPSTLGEWSGVEALRGACVRSVGLWYFVQRTKQCLDFSCTVHVYHLLACWVYNGAFPHTLSWWLLNTACVTVTCVCGEFLCIRTEMKAIPLSLSPKADL
ncbi:hypothetical protein HPB47_007157 [Ixodes persulcatus]|uniref:Uncharacterized protein n=1 Tax=Ixodes persulcatus TaxID=34615 RepID=A0AC60P8C6_IXOPE|nr:hypothetical protein HPB47_007157 [Ixodes persulcatus]